MGQAEVQAEGDKLHIGNAVYEFENEIDTIVVEEDIIIVQFAYGGDPYKEWRPDGRNVIGVDNSGTRVWKIEAPKDPYEGPFTLKRADDGSVIGITFEGRYEINPTDGSLEYISKHY